MKNINKKTDFTIIITGKENQDLADIVWNAAIEMAIKEVDNFKNSEKISNAVRKLMK